MQIPGVLAFSIDPRLRAAAARNAAEPATAAVAGDSVTLSGKKHRKAAPHAEKPAHPRSHADRPAVPTFLSMEEPATPTLSRHDLREEAGALGRDLASGKLQGEAFGKAGLRLAEIRQQADDPLTRHMARAILADTVQWKNPVDDWSLKLGAVEGPTTWLRTMAGHCSSDNQWFEAKTPVAPFLVALAQATAGAAVPAESVHAVHRLGRAFCDRASAKVSDKVREHESVEQDRAWSDACGQLLDHWWQNGQIAVSRDGQSLPPVSVDLLQEAALPVRGSRVLLHTPTPPPAPEVRAVLDKIDCFEKDAAVAVAPLQQADPALAAAAVAALVTSPQQGDDDIRHDIRRLTQVLKAGATAPRVQALLAPHAERMATLISDAAATGDLAPNNLVGESWVAFGEAFASRFPERVDTRFVQEELGTVLTCDEINTSMQACQWASRLLAQRPELASTIARRITDRDDERGWVYHGHFKLLEEALEHGGWKPDDGQMQWITSHLYLPAGRSKSTLFSGYTSNDRFRDALNLVAKLQAAAPRALDGVELPDLEGRMQPLQRALFDRAFRDPCDELTRNLFTRGTSGDPRRFMSGLYKLVFPDAAITEELLGKVEGAKGMVKDFPRDAQAAFVVLGSLDLEPPAAARFEKVLRGLERQSQGAYYFDEIVDRVRQADLQAARGRLAGGGLDAATAVREFRDAAEMARIGSGLDASDRMDKTCAAFLEGIGKQPAWRPAFERALDDFEAAFAKTGRLGDMSAADLGVLCLAERASRQDPAVLQRLKTILTPALGTDHGYGFDLVQPLLHRFRQDLVDEGLGRLRQEDLPAAERRTLVENCGAVAAQDYHFNAERVAADTRAAVQEGVAARGGAPALAHLAARLSADDFWTAYTALAGDAASDAQADQRMQGFEEILDYAGGEPQLTRAVDGYKYSREMADVPHEAILKHLVRCWSLGADPRKALLETEKPVTPPPTVEVGPGEVRVNGIALPVRP